MALLYIGSGLLVLTLLNAVLGVFGVYGNSRIDDVMYAVAWPLLVVATVVFYAGLAVAA
jgi:hypothetical protein